MRVSLKWLRDYLDLTLPVEEIARRLTIAGIEVEGIHYLGGSWDNVWVARIEKIEPHPNADRLTLVTASYGPPAGRRLGAGTGRRAGSGWSRGPPTSRRGTSSPWGWWALATGTGTATRPRSGCCSRRRCGGWSRKGW